ncbi:hypothetical protein [Mycolicibacterium mengxianglii]|uniref:hypothetical protein n=1 Tax=Mycolicibacterium mengxianglii TaxID=2736649 RepID=UPI0018D1DC9E|nr:hypothetical protein [Mycolicibacterium mengxianglii]
MAFKVYRDGPEPFQEYGDDAKFEIGAGGVLKITKADGNRLYINPTLWASIEETPPQSAYASPAYDAGNDEFDPMTAQF